MAPYSEWFSEREEGWRSEEPGRGGWHRPRQWENPHDGVGRWPSRQWPISSSRKAYFLEECGCIDYWVTPRLAAGTKPMGFPKGRSGSSSLWLTTGFKPRGRYNLIAEGAGPSAGGSVPVTRYKTCLPRSTRRSRRIPQSDFTLCPSCFL